MNTTASHPYEIKIVTVRSIVEDWFDKYDRKFIGSKELEQLIQEIENAG